MVVQKQRNFGPESGGGGVSVSAANKVRRGDIRHAVVVRTAKQLQREDGSVVKFDDNACVLINKGGEPIGTRLNGEFSAAAFKRRLSAHMFHRARRPGASKDEMVQDPFFSPNAPLRSYGISRGARRFCYKA